MKNEIEFLIREGTTLEEAACNRIYRLSFNNSLFNTSILNNSLSLADPPPLSRQSCLSLVAKIKNRTVGFVDYTVSKGHIKSLFIHPEFQDRGIGTAMLGAAQNRISGPIDVNVLSTNQGTILWYMKRGFKITGGWSDRLNGIRVVWIKMTRHKL